MPNNQIEPMTAAEYRSHLSCPPVTALGKRILAALEERERLLGEVANLRWQEEQTQPDADLGALVRRIRGHPAFKGACVWMPNDTAWHVPHLSDSQLEGCLSHLDSLLPKEPEVVVKLGGRTWTFGTSPVGNTNVWWRPGDGTSYVTASGELELALNALNALGGGK